MLQNLQPDSPGTCGVETLLVYSQPAFHFIREAVLDGTSKSPSGREDCAGVLYGTRAGNLVRVEAARQIACEHARGRSFLLSASDHAALKKQLTRESADPALQGLAVVGWFLSQAAPIRTAMTVGGKMALSSSDLQIFDEYFGSCGQVTLVLRPQASNTMHASIFMRRADGSVNAEKSDLNFPFTEGAALPQRAKELERKPAQRFAPAVRQTALAAAAAAAAGGGSAPTVRQTVTPTIPATSPVAEAASLAPVAPTKEIISAPPSLFQPRIQKPEPAKPAVLATPAPFRTGAGRIYASPVVRTTSVPSLKTFPKFGSYSEPAPRFSFEFVKRFDGIWGIAGLALLAGLASMPLFYRSQLESAPISLTVSEHNSQIQVLWNHSSRIIKEAAQGSIEILDGGQTRSAVLSADDLSHSNVIYVPQTGDVQIRLEVENAKGQKVLEVARFIESHPSK